MYGAGQAAAARWHTELAYEKEPEHEFVNDSFITVGVVAVFAETLRASQYSLFAGSIKGNRSFLLPSRGVYKVSCLK